MTVGERIKRRRKDLGISADDLAEMLGVSRSTVFRYENGFIEKLPADALEPIANALRTSVVSLMGWEEDVKTYQVEAPALSENEKALLDGFRKLNEQGQAEIFNFLGYVQSKPENLKGDNSAAAV